GLFQFDGEVRSHRHSGLSNWPASNSYGAKIKAPYLCSSGPCSRTRLATDTTPELQKRCEQARSYRGWASGLFNGPSLFVASVCRPCAGGVCVRGGSPFRLRGLRSVRADV